MDYAAEIAAWRARRVARLTSETGWLSLVDLLWLEEGGNATEAGVFDVRGRSATFCPGPGLAVTLDGRPVTGPIPVASDAAPEPTRLELGTRQFQLLRRGGHFALRVRDTENPARKRFRGIQTFPVDPAWRLEKPASSHTIRRRGSP
jgi:uncharacterized protein (DUF1684 family)